MIFSQDIGIDLGTASVLVYVRGKGVVLSEPSVVAVDVETGDILHVGAQAYRLLGRTPASIEIVRPLRDGVISNYDLTERMLHFFMQQVAGRFNLFGPRVVVCVPSGVTEVERRSVVEATLDAGARYTYLIEEPIAAAIGAGLDVGLPSGCMVVDIGGGTSDIAVISLGSAVQSASIKVAGDKFNEAILKYMRKKHNLLLGERTAEQLKIDLGAAFPLREPREELVTGRNLISGLPRTVRVTSAEMVEALDEPVMAIIEAIRQVLEKTPPELAADIFERGIVLTGGGALLTGIDRRISQQVRVPCYFADDPVSCVALGTGRALENIDSLGDLIFDYRRGRKPRSYR